MAVCPLGGHAASGRAIEEPELQEIGLHDVLDRIGLLADRCGQRRQADRSAAEAHAERGEDRPVDLVESGLVDIDAEGLDRIDRMVLETILTKFGGGPVGLSTLAVAVGEDQDTIEDVYEPYLLQRGFIKRTPRGRVATPAAYDHLGLPRPEPAASLF